MTRSGSLQYTVGGQNPACTDNTPPCTFSFRLPAVTLFFVPFGRKRVFSFLGRRAIVCHPHSNRARSKRRSFCAAFLCAFSYYGKEDGCAAKDSKAVVQCHKEKPTVPYMDAVGFCSYCKLFLFLKGIGQWLFRLVSGTQRRFCCGPFPCRRVVQMNTPGVVKGLNGHHRQRY